MKKLLFVLFVICLIAMPVMAQTEDNPKVMTWEELEQDFIDTGYSAKFYNIPNCGISILIPGGFEPIEISEENAEKGFEAIFLTADEENMIGVTLRDLECANLTEVAELAVSSDENIKFGGYYKINGFDAIMFFNAETNVLTTAIGTTTDGYFIQVSLTDMSNEEVNKLSGFVMGSIQPMAE